MKKSSVHASPIGIQDLLGELHAEVQDLTGIARDVAAAITAARAPSLALGEPVLQALGASAEAGAEHLMHRLNAHRNRLGRTLVALRALPTSPPAESPPALAPEGGSTEGPTV